MEALTPSLKMVPTGLGRVKGKTGHPIKWSVFLLDYYRFATKYESYFASNEYPLLKEEVKKGVSSVWI